jgi:hypothetical protein
MGCGMVRALPYPLYQRARSHLDATPVEVHPVGAVTIRGYIGFAMQAAEQGDAAAVERWLTSANNKIEQELRWIEENRCTAGGMASR